MIGGLLLPICLVLGGLVAAAPFVVRHFPDAASGLNRLARIQAWLGLALLLCGIWYLLFHALPKLMQITLLDLLVVGTVLALGFLLGHPLLHRWFLARHHKVQGKAGDLRATLVRGQVPIGLLAMVLGIVTLLR